MKYEYPAELPVSAARDEIASAVKRSQVVIVSGQTGSGKTTQLPKILLELGRGTHGKQIVHTQPRRIAARTVAERIASEMGVKLGDEVGYQVRFTDESSPGTRLRVVTDGILLAQIQRDPKLTRYDTIIIDEAHERSLNIDFLLGYLTALLPQRRDLKLIITSATIDSVKFQEHFEHALHEKVPVIEVSGRTFPVQVVYEPLGTAPALMREVPGFAVGARPGDADYDELASAIAESDSDRPRGRSGASYADDGITDMPTAVARACAELVIHSSHERGPRDILVFASGERDIHEFEAALRHHYGPRADDMRRPDAIEIMPLFARLSAADQHKVFESHLHQRIVIATNVAETSLTVPGIRYVVDPGSAVSPGIRRPQRSSVCRSSRSARPVPTRGPADAAVWPTASRSACIRVRITRPVRASPSRKSCVPRWVPWYSTCCRWAWPARPRTSRTSGSSIRRI